MLLTLHHRSDLLVSVARPIELAVPWPSQFLTGHRQAGQIMSDTAAADQGAKPTSSRSVLLAATGASRARTRVTYVMPGHPALRDQLR